jgi:hypothetical protein
MLGGALTRTGASSRDTLENGPVRASATHISEDSPGFVDQSLRRVILKDLSVPEDENAIVVEHSLEAVRYGDDDRPRKLFADSPLYLQGRSVSGCTGRRHMCDSPGHQGRYQFVTSPRP